MDSKSEDENSVLSVLQDAATCIDEATSALEQDGRTLRNILNYLVSPPSTVFDNIAGVDRLFAETLSLRTNVEKLVSACRAGMAERLSEVEELRKKLRCSQMEFESCQAQVAHHQSETARLRGQLEDQSAFCASLGAVLGNLVWKASRVPPVVDILLSGNKLADFLCIVSGTLDSFLETFQTVMPGPTADESQFIMAMGGIVTNMAAAPAGRHYLVTDPNGRDLIQHIIRVIPAIPTPSGNCLKRLLVMALYNVSINQAGLSLLLEENGGAVFGVVANCLQTQSTNELRLMALRLLLSLTCDLDDITILNTVFKNIPKDMIKSMVQQSDASVQAIAQEVLANLNRAQERIERGNSRNNQTNRMATPASSMPGQQTDGSSQYTALSQHTGRTAWKLPKSDVQYQIT